jgi:hypothetical protein
MGDLLAFLERIARKEVTGRKITDKEYEEIRVYGSTLEYLTKELMGDKEVRYDVVLEGPDRTVAVVADIATSLAVALEEGVGTIDEIFVIVEVNGVPTLTRGGVFSYYEFTWPVSDRLTDERWQLLLKENKAPARPDWTSRFLVPEWMPKMPSK